MGKTKIKTVDFSEAPAPEKKEKKKVVEPTNKGKVKPLVIKGAAQVQVEKPTPKTAKKKQPVVKVSRGKKYQEVAAKVNPQEKYALNEAVKLAQEASYSKFDGSLEAHFNTNAKNLRGNVSLPYLAGKKITILAFGPSTPLRVNKDAPEFEDVIWGSDETIAQIEKGKINFDLIVTTPEWMSKLAKVAKILGPRGLMPSPKNDTITDNLAKVISELRAGKTEYKTEKDGQVVHTVVGKVSQNPEEIAANIKTLYNSIGKSKITKITVAASMGPGVKVNLTSI